MVESPVVRGPAPATRRWSTLASVGTVVVVADQLTKTWALRSLDDGAIDLLGPLRLRLVFNTGSAFSLGAGLGPVLAIVGVGIVVLLLHASRDVAGGAALTALGLVLGGAVGNLADRALRAGDGFLAGGVVDFVDLQRWPVFNLADVAITSGVALLALTIGRAGSAPEVGSEARTGRADAGPDLAQR